MKGLLFTYLMTYGGFVAALFDPFLGLLIYICFAIIRPQALWFWAVPPGNYSRIVAIGLLIGWGLKGFGNWRFGRGGTVLFWLLAFYTWMVISAIQAPYQDPAWASTEYFGKIVLPTLVGLSLVDSVKKLKQLAWVIILSHGYLAYELNRYYFEGLIVYFIESGFGGMDNNCVAITMVACVGLAFFMGIHTEGWLRKALAFASGALMVHVVLFSFSRGGMLGLIIAGGMAFWLIPKKPVHYLAFALAVVLSLMLAGAEVRQRFFSTFVDKEQRDASAQSRLELWSAGYDSMGKRPFQGAGPANWPFVAGEYGYEGKMIHSLWIQVGAEMGIPGLVFLVLFYLTCIIRLWPVARGRLAGSDPWFRNLACMVIASLVGFAVSAQFVSLQGLETPYYVSLIGAGVLKLTSTPSAAPPWR
jgi:probable O-glycosylation ligase (exosortase A-associated)